MDDQPLTLTMVNDSFTQLLHLCHFFSLSIGIYMSPCQHTRALQVLIQCQQMLINVQHTCILQERRQFTDSFVAHRMVLTPVELCEKYLLTLHKPLLQINEILIESILIFPLLSLESVVLRTFVLSLTCKFAKTLILQQQISWLNGSK